MRKLAATVAAVLLAASAWGQTGIRDVIEIIRGKEAVSCHYSYIMRGDMPLNGKGTALLFGHRYHTSGNGIDTYSDGTTVWTVDTSAREVCISNAGESIVSHLEDYIHMVRDFQYNGQSLSCTLQSKDKSIDLDFAATGIKTMEPPAESAFVFDASTLDSSWIVTDLR